MTTPITPVTADERALAGWSDRLPPIMALGHFWYRNMPRGRGWFPRVVGRRFGKSWRATIRTAQDVLLAVDPHAFDTYVAIAVDGDWEASVLDTIQATMKPGDVFFDVGANVGFMSLSAAQRFRDAQVFSFEPQTGLAEHIAISAKLGGLDNVTVFSCMLGETTGSADLYLTEHSIHVSEITREPGAPKVVCPKFRIDDLIAAGTLPIPNLIKIDVEGAELMVLRGAAQLLRNHPPYVAFETDVNAERFGYTRRDLLAFLSEQADYRFVAMDSEPSRLRLLTEDRIDDPELRDILAVPPGAPVPVIG